jgi:hypothetical protein
MPGAIALCRALTVVAFASGVTTSCVSFSIRPIDSLPPTNDPSRSVSPGKGFGLVSDYDGQTVLIDADTDIIRLVLEDGWTWDVQVDPSFLRLYQQGPLVGQGFTAQAWFYRLLRTGETRVSARGTPTCRNSTPPCASPDRSFSVTVRTR